MMKILAVLLFTLIPQASFAAHCTDGKGGGFAVATPPTAVETKRCDLIGGHMVNLHIVENSPKILTPVKTSK